MGYDLDEYRNVEAMHTITGKTTYDSNSWLNKSGVIPLVARFFISMFRWYFWKYMFYLALMAVGVSMFNRDKIATNLANDGYL